MELQTFYSRRRKRDSVVTLIDNRVFYGDKTPLCFTAQDSQNFLF